MTRQVICLYGIFQTYMEFGGAEMPRQTIKRTGKRGPRPRGPYADKRKTLTTRITNKTRESLDAAAKATDRSLSQEIEFRLERSFLQDEADERVREAVLEDVYESFGTEKKTFLIMRALASVAQMAEQITGKSWLEDPGTNRLANSMISEAINRYGPAKTDEVPNIMLAGTQKRIAREALDVWRASLSGASKKKRRTKKKG